MHQARRNGAFRATAAGLAALALAACAGAPETPPAEACTLIGVSSNGWHAGLYLPADAFDPTGPVRTAYPDAPWFAIGWGDARAYPEPLTIGTAISAVAWPTPSAVHVAALPRDPRGAYRQDHADIAVSLSERDALIAAIEAEFARGPDAGPVRLGPGLDSRGSAFFAGRSSYHALNTCNVFMARRLEEAGIETGVAAGHWFPGSLVRALERRRAGACPA
ncbi:MAG: DUF2459 domain-containing protein [Oceanicaulis sp.]